MDVAVGVERDSSTDPARDWVTAIGRRELARLVVRLFRYRFFLAPLLTVFMAVFFIWDPEPWKLIWIGVLLSGLVGMSFVEYRRALKGLASLRTVKINLAAMTVFQAAMIYVTGGIESPLLPIFIPLCLGAGMVSPNWRQALLVAAIPIGATLFFAAGCLFDLFPRAAPAFFELGDGWGDKPVYVWTTAAVMTFLSLATIAVSNTIRRAIGNQVLRAVEARQDVIGSLAQRNKEILSVSRTIAHELKNPLASIQGLAQLLARSAEAGSKQAERLEVMQREIERMGDVLEGFRSFTRPLVGLQLEPVDLEVLVADVVALQEGLADQRGVGLELASVPIRLRCDPLKIKQALINLIQNAIEVSPAGARVIVRLGPWGGQGGGRIEVQDEGPGLSDEVRAHLFEPGFSSKSGGSGIGLVVARAITAQHGGELTLENSAAGGALAAMGLPAEPEPNPLDGAGTDGPRENP